MNNEYRESNKRERCLITAAEVNHEADHDCWVCYVMTESLTGGAQAFIPAFSKKKDAEDVAADVMEAFGVSKLTDLIGIECWVLRPFGYHNDTIEGLEAEDGKRFTLTDWQRKTKPDAPTRLDREKQRLEGDIRWAKRRLRETEERLRTVEDEYTEWSQAR